MPGYPTIEQGQLAHERNPSSETNRYGVSVPECNGTVADLSAGAVDVSTATPALLFGIYVNTVMSAHTVTLNDGVGGTALVTIPASTAAGTKINFNGIKFNTGLYLTPNASSTGSITLEWRAQ